MSMRRALRRALLAAIVLAVVSGCSLRQTGAATALPFAAVGDTLLAPFQGMGKLSTFLLAAGDAHADQMFEENKDSVALPAAEATSWVLYLPGYALWPFEACTPDRWYPMKPAPGH